MVKKVYSCNQCHTHDTRQEAEDCERKAQERIEEGIKRAKEIEILLKEAKDSMQVVDTELFVYIKSAYQLNIVMEKLYELFDERELKELVGENEDFLLDGLAEILLGIYNYSAIEPDFKGKGYYRIFLDIDDNDNIIFVGKKPAIYFLKKLEKENMKYHAKKSVLNKILKGLGEKVTDCGVFIPDGSEIFAGGTYDGGCSNLWHGYYIEIENGKVMVREYGEGKGKGKLNEEREWKVGDKD